MRAIALALAISLGGASCEFAQKHPAITAGIAGGSIGLLGCEMDSVSDKTCLIVGGSTAVFLGGIAALSLLLFQSADDALPADENDEEVTTTGAVRVHTHTAPPPVLIDAGIDSSLSSSLSNPASDAAPDSSPDAALP